MDIFSVIDEIKMNQKKGVYMIQRVKNDGTIWEFPAAKRGNSFYAWRSENKIAKYCQCFFHNAIDGTILFITLTVPYTKNYSGCHASWQFFKDNLSPFIKILKKMGREEYFACLESSYEGGCHAHIIVRFNKTLQTRKVGKKFYLADKELSEKIREQWIKTWKKENPLIPIKRPVQIIVCQDISEGKKVFNYITKWLGKGSNIETAIYNVEKNIESEGDVSKLFTNYFGMKLHPIRLFRFSKGLGTNITLFNNKE